MDNGVAVALGFVTGLVTGGVVVGVVMHRRGALLSPTFNPGVHTVATNQIAELVLPNQAEPWTENHVSFSWWPSDWDGAFSKSLGQDVLHAVGPRGDAYTVTLRKPGVLVVRRSAADGNGMLASWVLATSGEDVEQALKKESTQAAA